MTNRELAEALREISEKNSVSAYKRGVCAEAADTLPNSETHILALQKEIENLRNQLEAAQKTQWVNVDERLPEAETPVLCYCADGKERALSYDHIMDDWDFTVLHGHGYAFQRGVVTHWMPLPEPPSTEGVMERLTEPTIGCFQYQLKDHGAVPGEFGTYEAFFDYSMAVRKLGQYEDTGLTPEVVMDFKIFEDEAISKGVPFSRIVELMEADKDGRLVVLPCKVGDTVYRLFCGSKANPVISEVKINTLNDSVNLIGKMGMHKYIGCFLTREEAEAALKEAKDA